MNNNNEFLNSGAWNDDCTSRGACSIPPSVYSLQELLLYLIKQTSYYILELDKLSLNNEKLIQGIINSFSSLVLINELSEKHLYSLILQNYYALKNVRETYIEVCRNRSIAPNLTEYYINFDEYSSVSDAISIGDRILKKSFSAVSSDIRNYIQIVYTVLKSVCLNISRLYDFNSCPVFKITDIFKSLNALNNINISLHELLEIIKSLARKDLLLNLQISRELHFNFGQISKTNVSHSTREGKAILVSGSNFFDLLNILELTKDKNIDVYTHSGLLLAHAFEKFKIYDNLIGHYGKSSDDCIFDFGTFPGAIFLTNNSKNNTEFLYRGKIFSNDFNIPQGVTKVENNDYTLLINSALNSKGFSKGRIMPDSFVGFDETACLKIMENVFARLVNSEIKHLYIVIGNSFSEVQKSYFTSFLDNINDDEFVLSFSYGENKDNILVIDLGNCYPVIIDFIYKIVKNREANSKLTFIFDACSIGMISGVIFLKDLGADNIYVSHCSPRLINPAVFDTFVRRYSIKYTSNPVDDLKCIRQKSV